jgi:hypothetical protein
MSMITKSPGTKTTASRISPAISLPQMQIGAKSVYAADVDGDGDMDVLSASYLDDKIAWYENKGQQTLLLESLLLEQMGPNLSMPPMWMGTGTWMCSQHQLWITKSPGTKTTASKPSHPITLPPLQILPDPSMPPMWMVMGIWTCSRPHTMMTKSPGTKTTASSLHQPYHHHRCNFCQFRLCRRCGRGWRYGCALRITRG